MLGTIGTTIDWLVGSVLPSPAYYGTGPRDDWAALAVTPKPATESPIYRALGMAGADLASVAVAPTMAQFLTQSVAAHPDAIAFGYREQQGLKKTTKVIDGKEKEWQLVRYGPRVTRTYREFDADVTIRANGLRALGIPARALVGIYEETRPEWLVSLHALWRANGVVVTVYSNLGLDALHFAVNQTEMPAIITSAALALPLLTHKETPGASAMPTLKIIILMDASNPALVAKAQTKGIRVVSWEELAALGAKETSAPPAPCVRDDLAVVMYTSGTTGNPKGVMLSHKNLTTAAGCFVRRIGGFLSPGHVYCAYLPLAHVLELLAEHVMLHFGLMLGFGSPRTLMEAEPHGDLAEWRPVMFCGVPRVFDTIRKGALTKVEAAGGAKTRLGLAAFKAKIEANKVGRRTPVFDALVFGKLKGLVGGNVLHMISGGAPLAEETQQFAQAAFGVSVGQGYGLTETCAALTVQDYGDYRTLNVGRLVDSMELKLVDVPDMNYRSTDTPNPRGEIVVRGPNVASGYFREPAQTAEAFVDGWFCTGDVGELLPGGLLRVIDRKKNLVKLAMGEYVALERLEGIFGTSRFIMPNGIAVIAIPTESFLVALILPNKGYICANGGVAEDTYPAGLTTPAARAAVLADLSAIGKKAGVKPFEMIKDVELLNDEWTPENDILTAAMKLKRRAIADRYATVITALLARANGK